MSPNLPPDAGPALQELTKAHLALITDKKNEAQRENDLIYNAVLPTPETLPQIDKATVATPITIQEVYASPDVQKVIGVDMFIRLVPLSVHESASVYSEEKAKLVRGEVEKADNAEVEVKSALDALGIKQGLARFRAIAEGGVGGEAELPVEVRRWKEDIAVMEERESVDSIMSELTRMKDVVRRELDGVSRDLDAESRECEAMRVKYDHLWTQAPSAALTKTIRSDLKAHLSTLDAAAQSDEQVVKLWDSVKGEIALLLSPEIEDIFRASTEKGGAGSENLLDLDIGSEARDEEERVKIRQFVDEIDERLGRLNKIQHERGQVLKDLKDKVRICNVAYSLSSLIHPQVQQDDVSHLLLLNRRNTGVETTLFAGELEKFRPYQQRLGTTVHHEQVILQELSTLWRGLRDLAGRGPGAKKWEEREKRKKDTVRRFSRARDVYMEVRDGLAKGLQFYTELTELAAVLKRNANKFVSDRNVEREALASQAETERRLAIPQALPTSTPSYGSKPPVPPPPPKPSTGLESSLASMSLHSANPSVSSPPPQRQWTSPPPSSQHYAPPTPSQPAPPPTQPYPPPPPPSGIQPAAPYLPSPPTQPLSQPSYTPSAPPHDPYASLSIFGSTSTPSPPSSHPPPPQQTRASYGQPSQPPYGQPQRQQSYPPPPPSQPRYGAYQTPPPPPPGGSAFPPPPPPVNYQSQFGSSPAPPPPPPQQQPAQQQSQPYYYPNYGQQQQGSQQYQYPQGYGR